MGKSSKAPDPYQTAQAQTQSNKDTASANATLNRVDQYTPYGSSVYSVTGQENGVPTYRQDINLAPEAQAQLDNQLKQNDELSNLGFNLADQAGSALHGGIDTSGLPALRGGATPGHVQSTLGPTGTIKNGLDFSGAPKLYGADDFNGANMRTQAAEFAQAASRLNPQWNNSQNDLDSKLANQGVVQGSEAWQRAQDQEGRNRNDAYNQAIYGAIGAGNQEQQNLFGNSLAARQQSVGETTTSGGFTNAAQQQAYEQALASGQFANQAEAQAFAQQQSSNQMSDAARAQGLQEQTALRDMPMNELNALRGATQISNPQFTSVPQAQVAGTDISGDIYKSAQMDQANSNNFMNGLFGMGGAALGAAGQAGSFAALFSDRRLKRDIVRIGTTEKLRLPLYLFSYAWDRGQRLIGVMADEVARVMPSAVIDHPSGFKMVDYGRIS